MKRIFFILSFLVIGVSLFAGKFTIKSMNVKSIKIGNNRTCYEGSDFYDYEVIHWTSANEEMIVLDHQANKKRCFSKSLFEANKFKTAGDFYKKVSTPATLSASAQINYKVIQPKVSIGEKRYALIIGNSNYIHENTLRAPISDAAKISDVLANIGFKVFLLMDAQKSEMEQIVKDFSKESSLCDVALFYYEGHGQQVDGEMYFIPIEATIKSPADIYNCVFGPYVVRALDETKAKSKLIFIDACRSEGNYQMGSSLPYTMDAPTDGVVMFSTQSGKYAYDGLTISSTYFARAFMDKIKTPDVNITEILSDIVVDVSKNTKGYTQQQIPTYSSSLTHKLVLVKKTENYHKITFNVSPSNAKLYFGDEVFSIGQPLSFKEGSSYTYRVVADGYHEETATFTVNNNTPSSINIALKKEGLNTHSQIKISKIEFCNCSYGGQVLSEYGKPLYAYQMRYLKPKITIQNNTTSKNVDFYIKIIKPDGTLSSGEKSPTGYSFKETKLVSSGISSMELTSWGYTDYSTYKPGWYEYSIWVDNVCLINEKVYIQLDTWAEKLDKATQKILGGKTSGTVCSSANEMGFYRYNNGTLYFWSTEGKRDAYGIYICSAGDGTLKHCSNCIFYVGGWRDGAKNSMGTCYDSNGKLLYGGNFENDAPTGTYPSTGSYSAYKFETIEYDGGHFYIGETKNGKRHGYGICIWNDGKIWYGKWNEGNRDESKMGVLFYTDGSTKTGYWKVDEYSSTPFSNQ